MARKEDNLQSKCILWFNRTYPSQRGTLFWVPNELIGKSSGWTQATCKTLGLVSGISDTLWLAPNGKAISIEFKTATGKQSTKQRKWQERVEANGHEYHIVRTFEEFQAIVWKYVGNA